MPRGWPTGLTTFVKENNIKTDQWGRLLLYKAVLLGRGAYWTGPSGVYRDGALVKASRWNTSRRNECGEGLHVSTLSFARNFANLYHLPTIIQVAVDPKDVVCVPIGRSQKIRCKQLYVIGEVK